MTQRNYFKRLFLEDLSCLCDAIEVKECSNAKCVVAMKSLVTILAVCQPSPPCKLSPILFVDQLESIPTLILILYQMLISPMSNVQCLINFLPNSRLFLLDDQMKKGKIL